MGSGSHDNIDSRSLALHKAVAAKILNDYRALEKAQSNLNKLNENRAIASQYLEQWTEILSYQVSEVCRLITEDSEKMRQLRQSSPFAGVLAPRERWKIYESFSTRTRT